MGGISVERRICFFSILLHIIYLLFNSLIIIDLWIEYIIYCIDLNICLYNILA